MYPLEIYQYKCSLEIPLDDFLAIHHTESISSLHKEDRPEELEQKLARLPMVSQIEYNGHFGSAIFFCLDMGYTRAIVDDVRKAIAAHVEECKAFIAKHPDLIEKMEK
jgi:hypothetical protein